ncbi:MAG: alpha/beta hydrolase, partial [Stellaceae bacterium]
MWTLRCRGAWGGVIAGLLMLAGCAPALHDRSRADSMATAQIDPSGPPRFTSRDFVTADGQNLPLRGWLPPAKPKAVILGLHGFNDYSHAFADPAALWARQGIATYAYDQRGFGAAPDRGHWPGGVVLAADAAAASRVLRSLYPDVPLYL